MFGRILVSPPTSILRQGSLVLPTRGFATSYVRAEAAPVATTPHGSFVRPHVKQGSTVTSVTTPVARPHTPSDISEDVLDQAPNAVSTWSESQRPKAEAMRGPRFEQMDFEAQPHSLSAMELIANVPIVHTTKRVVSCDGGDGPLGHPRVYINLDKPGPKPCPYCGVRFELEHHH
ncbi:hypothetical protein MCUN1_000036 [Malassezia cuniculi]|uniref:Zinc finger CHCC-type domain-containing protein n=1 Tax=Malassezia cuniculi TaxID=948313 RepID=A0AAF0J4I2_9BASI|nr:hypothetical protein MCUN1_000036 [Malassezia cuniculi]